MALDTRAGLHVEPIGLTTAEALLRLTSDGPNRLPSNRHRSLWRGWAGQMVHFFALMLWGASALAAIAGMPQLAVAIGCVVVINGTFAFGQEARSERAASRLRDLMPRRCKVVRDGRDIDVDADSLVRGDVVRLEAGDGVPADLTLRLSNALAIDSSMLTGESVTSRPAADEALFAGTYVVEGDALAEVTATGGRTRLASIARLTTTGHRPTSPLTLEIDRAVRIVGVIAIVVGVSFFVIAVALGMRATDGFLFGIGVTVALVPEGLLPTVTLSLAVGAQRMADRHALVRRLDAVETLGSTTFICTDKTGTLTRNEMCVVDAWTPTASATFVPSGYQPVRLDEPTHPSIIRLTEAAVACSTGRLTRVDNRDVPRGDPMEVALDVVNRRVGGALPDHDEPTSRLPFDSRRRRMSTVIGRSLIVKGAPDSVIPLCSDAPEHADQVLHDMMRRGLRVIAVATRPLALDHDFDVDVDELEQDLNFLGLLGLEDPPRETTKDSLAACRRAGIKVAMVTGDHPITAHAIAAEVGLWVEGAPVLEGAALPAGDAELGALIDCDGVVIARVDPEAKLRIAQVLQARGHVVAMTGDGVNDGPALYAADIGIAMGKSGTDVAREAADLVLLDDDFATVVAAVEYGRATYLNVRRFLTYHLTDNVAELAPFVVWALSGGRYPLALAVLQILCLDIGTDLLPALALGSERPAPNTLEQPPLSRHLIDRSLLIRSFAIFGPVEAIVEMTAFGVALWSLGWSPSESLSTHGMFAASGAAFSAVVFGQAATAFACRSTSRPPWKLGWSTNRLLLAAVGIELATLASLLALGPVASAIHLAVPPLPAFMVALTAFPLVLVADAMHKRVRGLHR